MLPARSRWRLARSEGRCRSLPPQHVLQVGLVEGIGVVLHHPHVRRLYLDNGMELERLGARRRAGSLVRMVDDEDGEAFRPENGDGLVNLLGTGFHRHHQSLGLVQPCVLDIDNEQRRPHP